MSREEFFRLPVVYVLSALGMAVGVFMTYIYGPLEERVSELESRSLQTERVVIENRSDIKNLMRRRNEE